MTQENGFMSHGTVLSAVDFYTIIDCLEPLVFTVIGVAIFLR